MNQSQLAMNYIISIIEEEETNLVELESQLTAGLPFNVYSGYCLEIEKTKGKILGLLHARRAMREFLEVEDVTTTEVIEEAVVTQEGASAITVEPSLTNAEKAYNHLITKVKFIPEYVHDTLQIISKEPNTIKVEFKGSSNPNWISLDVAEDASGNITYGLEKRRVNTYGYSGLETFDSRSKAMTYIRRELKKGSH